MVFPDPRTGKDTKDRAIHRGAPRNAPRVPDRIRRTPSAPRVAQKE